MWSDWRTRSMQARSQSPTRTRSDGGRATAKKDQRTLQMSRIVSTSQRSVQSLLSWHTVFNTAVQGKTANSSAPQLVQALQTLSVVVDGRVIMYSELLQAVKRVHWRSEEGVGATVWYSKTALQTVSLRHCRSLVEVGAAVSNSSLEQTVTAAHRRLLLTVQAVVWYCREVHVAQGRQTLSKAPPQG